MTNIEVARRGGKIASHARRDLESESGADVITSDNGLNYRYIEEKKINK